MIKQGSAIGMLGNKYYWTGLDNHLVFPRSGTYFSLFQFPSILGKYGFSQNNLIYFHNQVVTTSGWNSNSNLGATTGTYDKVNVMIGFLMGQTVKQVGGTSYTSFIVTQSAIYSTNSAQYGENGGTSRTVVSPFWGRMQIPSDIKIILKA